MVTRNSLQMQQNTSENFAVPTCTDVPMDKLLDMWLETKKICVKPSSFAHYRRVVEKILKPRFKHYSSTSVTPEVVRQIIEMLLQKYTPTTTQSILMITNQILQFMCDQNYTYRNPKRRIKLPNRKTRPVVFTCAEQNILTKYLTADMNTSKLGMLISLYTGLRIGELCGLQWQDVDMTSNLIRVRRTIQRISDGSGHTYFMIGKPKTVHSEREIPVPDFLMNLMKQYRSFIMTTYVTSGTENFTQPRTYENRYKKILRDCGLPEYHFHTLRHTFATRAIELGFDPKSLSEILGHSDVKMTLDLYVHPSLELKKREMARFAAIFKPSNHAN